MNDSHLGFAAFTQSAAAGTLKDLSTDQMLALAGMSSADTRVASHALGADATKEQIEDLVIGETLSQKFSDFGRSLSEGRTASFARMRSARRAAMFEKAGLSEDDVTRVAFDAENGDPSQLNLIKERYFFE